MSLSNFINSNKIFKTKKKDLHLTNNQVKINLMNLRKHLKTNTSMMMKVKITIS